MLGHDNEGRRRTVFANLVHYRHQCEIFFVSADRKQYGKTIVPVIEMVDMPIDPSPIPATVVVDMDIAQEIVDALFMAGIHPTAYRETYSQMVQMQRTLDDIKDKLTNGFVMKVRARGDDI